VNFLEKYLGQNLWTREILDRQFGQYYFQMILYIVLYPTSRYRAAVHSLDKSARMVYLARHLACTLNKMLAVVYVSATSEFELLGLTGCLILDFDWSCADSKDPRVDELPSYPSDRTQVTQAPAVETTSRLDSEEG
jgi:hypothetical protein